MSNKKTKTVVITTLHPQLICVVVIFQVVASPQIGFAQEAMASAPPPYSEFAPPAQVTGFKIWD